jgi:acetolactate synthase-1/2/3 large subunit
MSQLGFGLPHAMALQPMFPGRLVVNLTSDGAFGLTLQELHSARRLRLPVVKVVHNNAAWGLIRAGQRMQFDLEPGTSLEDTDCAAIARGFGCHGEWVTQAADLPAFGSMNRYGFDALTRSA